MVGSPSRQGSNEAAAYPMGESTAVVCAPDLVARLSPINGGPALSNDASVLTAAAIGGTPAGWGPFRVIKGAPEIPTSIPPASLRWIVLGSRTAQSSLSSSPPALRKTQHCLAWVIRCSPGLVIS